MEELFDGSGQFYYIVDDDDEERPLPYCEPKKEEWFTSYYWKLEALGICGKLSEFLKFEVKEGELRFSSTAGIMEIEFHLPLKHDPPCSRSSYIIAVDLDPQPDKMEEKVPCFSEQHYHLFTEESPKYQDDPCFLPERQWCATRLPEETKKILDNGGSITEFVKSFFMKYRFATKSPQEDLTRS